MLRERPSSRVAQASRCDTRRADAQAQFSSIRPSCPSLVSIPSSVSGSRLRSASRRPRSCAAGTSIAAGRHTLIAAPTGSGKTLAAFLTAINALLEEEPGGAAARRGPRPLRVAAQGAERRHPQEPGRAARGHPSPGCSGRAAGAADHRGGAHRRHDAGGAGGDAADAAAHPGHDAGIAVSAAHVGPQPPDAAHGAHGHRRRDPRRDRHAPRRAPGADARAARRGGRTAALQRIGLSATQTPIEEVARFLTAGDARRLRHRRRRPPAPHGPRRRDAALAARRRDVARGLGGVLRPARRRSSPPTGRRWSS